MYNARVELRAYLFSKIQASVVGHKDPAAHGTCQGKGPCDPELVTVAQVIEPHDNANGAHLASSCRNAVGCASDGSWIHLHTTPPVTYMQQQTCATICIQCSTCQKSQRARGPHSVAAVESAGYGEHAHAINACIKNGNVRTCICN